MKMEQSISLTIPISLIHETERKRNLCHKLQIEHQTMCTRGKRYKNNLKTSLVVTKSKKKKKITNNATTKCHKNNLSLLA